MEHLRQESRSVSIMSACCGVLCLMFWGMFYIGTGTITRLKPGWVGALVIACLPFAFSVLFAFVAAFTDEE